MAIARPALGVVYTPREVAEPMVRRALEPLLGQRELRVCDPAIGEGAFLVEILRVLAEAGRDPRDVAARTLFGVDIDARAVARARAAVEAFVGEPVPALREHLRVADALTCEWPHRFDAVVGNPPYIRQERIADKRALRAFEVYDGVADLYVYFVELAHRLADRYCLILPNKWMTAAYGRALRDFLAREGTVEGVVDFASALSLFSDADAFPCILWGSTRAAGPIAASRATTQVATALASTTPHARERWRSEPWHIDAASDAKLIDRIAKRWPALDDVIPDKPSRGVVTGCNRAFVIDAATRSRLLERDASCAPWIRPLIKGRDIRAWQPAKIERYLLLVDRGTRPPRAILDHLADFRAQLEPRPREHAGAWQGRKPGTYRWYELQDPVVPLAKSRAPRLFYQDIQTQPACCLDRSGELVPDTTVWILPTDDRFVLALLNSRLYGWYARRRFPPALNGAVRPKLEYMRKLPIAQPPADLRAAIARTHDIDELICDAYELSRAERALVRGE